MGEIETNHHSPSQCLPLEILIEIAKHLDPATLTSLSATNRVLCSIAEKLIWRSLQVKYSDVKPYCAWIKVYRGPEGVSREFIKQPVHGGLVQALVTDPSTDGPVSRSRIHIKNLVFKLDVYTLEDLNGRKWVVSNTLDDDRLASFISRLPRLESCSFEGDVQNSTLEILTCVRTLHTLELRTLKCNIAAYFHGITLFALGDNYGWLTQQTSSTAPHLRFTCLTQFPNLRRLSIGEIRQAEAIYLRTILPTLQLESLRITVKCILDPYIRHLSTFETLFWFSATEPRLPSTLKSLLLLGEFALRTGMLSARKLLNAIKPCRELAYLRVSHLSAHAAPDKRRYMAEFKAIPSMTKVQVLV